MLVAKFAGIKNGILEVGDLIKSSSKSSLFRLFEKFILHSVNGLVLTSKKYYIKYYKDIVDEGKTSVFIIENKIPKSLTSKRISKDYKPKIKGPIAIGLIGFLRYEPQIVKLVKYVNKLSGKVILKVFGDGPCKKIIQENESEHIKFYGSFKSPEDLSAIYDQIDLNFVVYDTSTLNVRLALPNKLYESAFCSTHSM